MGGGETRAASRAPKAASEDVVGDRARLLGVGMVAVFAANVVFAVGRLAVHLATGLATPWWVNAVGAVAIVVLLAWYRGDPARRTTVAVHATALTATVAMVVPAAYGMTSSKWWLALVGFAVLLMGRRIEALFWTVAILVVMPLTALIEPSIQIAASAGESPVEHAMAALFFAAVLFGITWGFRRIADRRARELTETAASLTRANLVKSRFLAHMSHEVRTPLHGVIAMTDLALGDEASTEAHDHVQSAQQSARTLLGLLNNVLDVTRAEADALELDPRPFDLHASVSDVLRPLAAQARAKGLALEARAQPGIVERRLGDKVRVAQIILNLVGNALKFTRDGSIRVSLRTAAGNPDLLVLEVADTGVGIPRDKIDLVFEPFEQASVSDAGVQGGAGLGLAIVRELCRLMGGSVSVRSEVGRGSTFTVELRLPHDPGGPGREGPEDLLPPTPRTSKPPSIPPGAPHLRVLVCEDNPVNQKVLIAMLVRLGHEPVLAVDGLSAWELVQRETFDMLLTDVEIPGIDGLELARRIRARERGTGAKRLPVVGATAHAADADRERLAEAGMDAHLGKPFTLAELSTVLANAVAR